MAADIPSIEPARAVAGETWKWTRDISDWPASIWTLTYALINAAAKASFAATADGDVHSVNIDEVTTAAFTAGDYRWQASVTDGTDVFVIDSGEIEIVASFADATTLDARSHAQTTLDAIEAVIERRATKDQMSYSIGERSLAMTPIADLIRFRKEYRAEVAKEKRAARIAAGKGHSGRVLSRFGSA